MAILLLLTGCGARETFETVEDWYFEPVAQPGEPVLQLPQEAVSAALSGEQGCVYLCDGYSVSLQTLPGGDLGRTVREISGYAPGQLELIETRHAYGKRYDFVWAAAGETGDQVGRCAVLDDGSWHYVLCVMADADGAQSVKQAIGALFSSFSLAQS